MKPSEAAFLILLAVLLSRVREALIARGGFLFLLVAPEVIMHELSHFIAGLLTFAHPSGFSIWPVKEGERYVMGMVVCKRINRYNAPIVGLAPVLLGAAGFYASPWIFSKLAEYGAPGYALFLITEFILFNAAVPSSEDLKTAFLYPLSVFVYVFVLFIVWFSVKRLPVSVILP